MRDIVSQYRHTQAMQRINTNQITMSDGTVYVHGKPRKKLKHGYSVDGRENLYIVYQNAYTGSDARVKFLARFRDDPDFSMVEILRIVKHRDSKGWLEMYSILYRLQDTVFKLYDGAVCPECASTDLNSYGLRWICKKCMRTFRKKYRKRGEM